ncbi:MAG: ribosome silencing factor [Planctomycetota bacterium]
MRNKSKTHALSARRQAKVKDSKLTKTRPDARLPVGMVKSGRDFALLCADLIEAKRGFDITILNVSKLLQITDYFIICSGKNKKQNQAIADNLYNNSKLYQYGYKPEFSSIHGYQEGLWILVDLGRVIVHIFSEPLRKYYDLEFLWASAPRVKK